MNDEGRQVYDSEKCGWRAAGGDWQGHPAPPILIRMIYSLAAGVMCCCCPMPARG